MGTLAVQLARWRGARVLAKASARDTALVRSLGADDLIDYHAARIEEMLRDVDVVLDTIGGEDAGAFLARAAERAACW